VPFPCAQWHLGAHPSLQPLRRGFERFFGFLSGGHSYLTSEYTLPDLYSVASAFGSGSHDWYLTYLRSDDEPVRTYTHDYLIDELTDAAVDFIQRAAQGPFFLYFA
jgi:arylsulfatase A-like enzyme